MHLHTDGRYPWGFREELAEEILLGGVICGDSRTVDACRDPGYLFACDWKGRVVREAICYFDMGGCPDAGLVGRHLYLRGHLREEGAMDEIIAAVEVFAAWTRGEWVSLRGGDQ
jgi:hypothetical protein